MLTALSIRDVVLIERLSLSFGPGLTALTGETGAGKSILLDSLGLALGMRADAGLVRAGAEQASVMACFAAPRTHAAIDLLAEQGLDASDEEIVLRRIVTKDGKSRAFVNDQPVSVGLLRRIGGLLVEVQGQHDQMGLADAATHTALLDAFGVAPAVRAAVASAWQRAREAERRLAAGRAALAETQRDEEWLRHAVHELAALAPQPEEEERLADQRRRLQQSERWAEAVAAALGEIAPRDRRTSPPAAALRAAIRALQRLATSDGSGPAGPAMAALERAEEALADAETLLSRLADDTDADPRVLEQTEERLFALRAAARKHAIATAELPALLDTLSARLAALESGAAGLAALEREAASWREEYRRAASRVSEQRQKAAARLERAVAEELPPLRLDKARFVVELRELAEADWGEGGVEAARFLIAANPGQAPGPLGRVASGGELSRLMLALKVVLSGDTAVQTLVFDEVDSGIGGATAAAVGERLTRLAERVQLLVVTHSPQVAAHASFHLRVSKQSEAAGTVTLVDPLSPVSRREEIARMLAGERITEAARAAADDLLTAAS